MARLRQEPDPEVASCLIQALSVLGGREAVPVLIDMTRHADGYVRYDAVRALGKLRDPRAIPALEALLSDPTQPFRRNEDGVEFKIKQSVADVAAATLRQIQGC
jgi:HEAT repeat protein